jgi:VanZ like protein
VLATAAWIAFALIVFATLSPLSLRPTVTANPNIERFASFGLLGLLFGLVYPRRLVAYLVFVITTAAVLETFQVLVHDRHAHLLDAVVKAAGGAVGIGVAFITMAQRAFRSSRLTGANEQPN